MPNKLGGPNKEGSEKIPKFCNREEVKINRGVGI